MLKLIAIPDEEQKKLQEGMKKKKKNGKELINIVPNKVAPKLIALMSIVEVEATQKTKDTKKASLNLQTVNIQDKKYKTVVQSKLDVNRCSF